MPFSVFDCEIRDLRTVMLVLCVPVPRSSDTINVLRLPLSISLITGECVCACGWSFGPVVCLTCVVDCARGDNYVSRTQTLSVEKTNSRKEKLGDPDHCLNLCTLSQED